MEKSTLPKGEYYRMGEEFYAEVKAIQADMHKNFQRKFTSDDIKAIRNTAKKLSPKIHIRSGGYKQARPENIPEAVWNSEIWKVIDYNLSDEEISNTLNRISAVDGATSREFMPKAEPA